MHDCLSVIEDATTLQEQRGMLNQEAIHQYVAGRFAQIDHREEVDSFLRSVVVLDYRSCDQLERIQALRAERLNQLEEGRLHYQDLDGVERESENFVECAFLKNEISWEQVPARLKQNQAWLKKIIIHRPEIFLQLDPEVKAIPALAKMACSFRGEYFAKLSSELQHSFEIISTVIEMRPELWRMVPQSIYEDRGATHKAIVKNPLVFQYVFPEFLEEAKMLALSFSGGLYALLPPEDQCRPEIIARAVQTMPVMWTAIPQTIKSQVVSPQFLSQIIRSQALVYAYLEPQHREDRHLAALAVAQSAPLWRTIDPTLQQNDQFALEMIRINPAIYPLTTHQIKLQLAGWIVENRPEWIAEIPYEFFLEEVGQGRTQVFTRLPLRHPHFIEICKVVIRENSACFQLINPDVFAHPELLSKLVKANPKILAYCSADQIRLVQETVAFVLKRACKTVGVYDGLIELLDRHPAFDQAIKETCGPFFSYAVKTAHVINHLPNDDEKVVLAIEFITGYPQGLTFLISDLQVCKEVFEHAVRQDVRMWRYAIHFKGSLINFAREQLTLNPDIFEHLIAPWRSHLDFIRIALSRDLNHWQHVPVEERLKADFVRKALLENPALIRVLEPGYVNNLDFILDAAETNIEIWKHVLPEFALAAVARDARFFFRLEATLRSNRSIIDAAVAQQREIVQAIPQDALVTLLREQGHHYQFLTDLQKKDWIFLLAASESFPQALNFTSARYRDEFIRSYPDFFNHLNLEFKKEILLNFSCVVSKPSMWHAVLPEFKADRLFCRAVLEANGYVIQHMPAEAMRDEELLKIAVKSCPMIVQALPLGWYDRHAMIRIFDSNPKVVFHLPSEIFDDQGVLAHVLAHDGTAIDILPQHLRTLENFKIALRTCYINYRDLPQGLKTFHGVLECLTINPEMLKLLPTRFRSHEAVVLHAVSRCGLQLKYALGDTCQSEAICRAAVEQNGLALEFVPQRLRTQKELCLLALRKNGHAIKFVPLILMSDPVYIQTAVAQNPDAILSLPLELLMANQQMARDLMLEHPILNIHALTAHQTVLGSFCYIPRPIADAKRIRLRVVDAPREVILARLDQHFTRVIQSLRDEDLPRIRAELDHLSYHTLDQYKAALTNFQRLLINRVTRCLPYLGTPPAAEPERVRLFYDHLYEQLKYVVPFLESEDSFKETMILLNSQSACATRLREEVSQLFLQQIGAQIDATSLDQQLVLSIHHHAKKAIASLFPDGNPHGIAMLSSQLHRFLGSAPEPVDHLAQPLDLSRYQLRFLKVHCARAIVTEIRDAARVEGSPLQELFTQYIMDNYDRYQQMFFSLDTLKLDLELRQEAHEAWSSIARVRQAAFERYLRASATGPAPLAARVGLSPELLSCRSMEEFQALIPEMRERFIALQIDQGKQAHRLDTIRKKLYSWGRSEFRLDVIAQILYDLKLFDRLPTNP
jgi:hypothetical protein